MAAEKSARRKDSPKHPAGKPRKKPTGRSEQQPMADAIAEQLAPLREVRSKPMFGGHGFYCGTHFFGVLAWKRLFLFTSEATRPKYEARGCAVFQPGDEVALSAYYEVPLDVLEDPDLLCQWAREAVEARKAMPARKGRKR